jgi:hypothetical protein
MEVDLNSSQIIQHSNVVHNDGEQQGQADQRIPGTILKETEGDEATSVKPSTEVKEEVESAKKQVKEETETAKAQTEAVEDVTTDATKRPNETQIESIYNKLDNNKDYVHDDSIRSWHIFTSDKRGEQWAINKDKDKLFERGRLFHCDV